METNNQIILDLRDEVQNHVEDELVRDTTMASKIQNLENKVDQLSTDVKTLLEMWQQAKGIITFVKWMAGISGGLVAVIIFIKDYFKL